MQNPNDPNHKDAPAVPEANTPTLMEVQERLGLFAAAPAVEDAQSALAEKPLALV